MLEPSEPGVVAAARAAYARGDFDELGRIVAAHPLEFWFGMPATEVFDVLRAVPPATLRRHPTAATVLRVLSSAPIDPSLGDGAVETASPGGADRFRQAVVLGQGAQARLAGDPVRAFALMRGLRTVVDAVPYLIDPSRGERTFALVQTAITGMLAGRFTEALALFEKSLVPPLPPSLVFLHRDAHVRSAMIHALYGDPAQAAAHLAAARKVPRTSSWVEPILDSDEGVVVALLRPESEADLAFESVAATTVGRMHELWPFHVAAISHLAAFADRRDDGRRRLQEIADAGLAQRPGAGLTGSSLALGFAFDALLSGAVQRAQELLATADQRFWLTKVLLAYAAYGSGAHARALRLARSVSSQTRDLLQAEATRVIAVALAHFGLGDESAALQALSDVPTSRTWFSRRLLARFSPALLALAAARLPDWAGEEPAPAVPAEFDGLRLTARELEVLAGLAEGRSRGELAESLHLSLNTVKSHQRSLYRKLGASSVAEAIAAGRRRGLV